jgi:hypothetical protein
MQNNKNGGRVRLKDIQNMLAKDFNIHYQNINGVHYLTALKLCKRYCATCS